MRQWFLHLFWRLFQLVLAAALLAIDIRLFLFYAFVVLLALLNYVYRLRSMFTLFQSCNDARSFLLMRHAGITNEAARALGRTMARDCGEDVRARLDRDTRSATGFIFNSFEEWMAQFVGSTRYL